LDVIKIKDSFYWLPEIYKQNTSTNRVMFAFCRNYLQFSLLTIKIMSKEGRDSPEKREKKIMVINSIGGDKAQSSISQKFIWNMKNICSTSRLHYVCKMRTNK